MKRKYQELLAVLIILFIYLGIFINPKLIIESGITSINIFKTRLFPSIFPFFVLASLLLNLGLADKISRKINFIIKRVFHIEGISSFIVVISIISGFPSGSKYISDCYKKGLINKRTANYLLTFTHFGNPLFILGTCGIVLNDITIAYKILIINIVANIILGIILRPKEIISSNYTLKNEKLTFMEALPNAINDAIKLLLFMLGSITFFMFFSKLLTSLLNLNDFYTVIITGILDLTSGVSMVNTLNISSYLQGLIVLSFITFGSLSVHLQVINNIKEQDLSYKYFFIGRIIETSLALHTLSAIVNWTSNSK